MFVSSVTPVRTRDDYVLSPLSFDALQIESLLRSFHEDCRVRVGIRVDARVRARVRVGVRVGVKVRSTSHTAGISPSVRADS